MKFRKIFTFILLLCTIFSTLLFINPTSKAVAPTDLTGYTIELPRSWSATSGYGKFSISGSFTDGQVSHDFDTLYIGYTPPGIATNGVIAYGVEPMGEYGYTFWNDSFVISTFVIVGGVDVSNVNLINWFESNLAIFTPPEEPEPEPTYTISGQYQFNEEITWLYDTSEQEGILYLPFYVYNLDNPTRVNYDYMLNQNREDLGINYFLYANETDSGTFIGQYSGRFTTSTIINMFGNERIVYFYTAEVSQVVYTWLNENGRFINDPTLDPNNPDNPNSGNNPNNPNNPDFGTDTVRQIVNQVNTFLGIQLLPGLSFRDILLICIALPLLMYILKVFLGG